MVNAHQERKGSAQSVRIHDDMDLKDQFVHVEDNQVHENQVERDPNADYSGFTQKTDPVEIRLVRKLDMYIMVSARDQSMSNVHP